MGGTHFKQMASVSLQFCLGDAPLIHSFSKFHAPSLTSSSQSSHVNNLSSIELYSRRTLFAKPRNAVVCCSSVVHGAEILTSMEPQLKTYWFIVCPSICVPLFAMSSESPHRFVKILDSTRSVMSKLVPLLFRHSAQWQGVQRCAVQVSAVLILANALHSNIAAPSPNDTFENVPQDISGGEVRKRIQRPKSKKAERCTQKCVGTCINPGEGPFNVRKPLVVFKEGFRSRQYCLIECSDICNLIGDGDDGP